MNLNTKDLNTKLSSSGVMALKRLNKEENKVWMLENITTKIKSNPIVMDR